MSRRVAFTKAAARALVRMPTHDARRVRTKIDAFANDPSSLANNVKAFTGSDYIRLHVGDYRVIMTADLVVVEIAIGVSGGIYD